jgi:PKD repeat protein
MKPLFKFLIIILISLIPSMKGFGQENYASNVHITVSEEKKLFISYDITAVDGANHFNVVLQLIYQNKEIKVRTTNLYGDYGHAVTPGSKLVYWDYSTEFTQDINKVEVKVFAYKENEPKASFKIVSSSGNLSAPCEIKFTNTSTFSDKYEWNFGDPESGQNTVSVENPVHTFGKQGTYTISLTAFNSSLGIKSVFHETIIVNEPHSIVADFEIPGIERLNRAPVKVKFLNKSVNADGYTWNFGDPNSSGTKNTSSVENPAHKYKKPGQFQIVMVAKNSASGITSIKTMELALAGAPEKSKEYKTNPEFIKHKNLKTIWLGAGIVSLATGTFTLIESNRLYNEYERAVENATDLHRKINTYDIITPVAYGISALSAVQVYIQSRKQSAVVKTITVQMMPNIQGGTMKLSCNF